MWSNFLSIQHDENTELFETKIMLVVDSDLGNIPTYNDHSTKLYTGWLLPCNNAILTLPQNFTMCYAKSDTPNDSLLNKMIWICDHLSNEMLQIISNDISSDEILRDEILDIYKSAKSKLNDPAGFIVDKIEHHETKI